MMKALARPARLVTGQAELDAEMRSARWIYHRLLDFEDAHQQVLDAAAEAVAPGISRVARLVARLLRRTRRRERTASSSWSPNPHSAWLAGLRAQLNALRKVRNAHQVWRDAVKWADTPAPGAPERGGPRRRAGETAEEFAARCATRRTMLTRREAWRAELYRGHVADGARGRSRIYWGTWNSLLKSVDQARKSVLQARKAGLPANWRRPQWNDPSTIAADAGGFRVLERGRPWWALETRLCDGWVRFRAKCGNWHSIPESAKLRTLKLTRRKNGCGWSYSVSIAVAGMPEPAHAGDGVVALDWGYREHGHPHERDGLRVFTWRGEDGAIGEILLPSECRAAKDREQQLQARIDAIWNARCASMKLPERNRHSYRSRLMRSGVRTAEEQRWLNWETRYERRRAAARKRWQNLRSETYLQAVHALRRRYDMFAVENETIVGHRRTDKDEQTRHRKRQNRELSARYEFLQICERSGATILPVPSRNSTRECPHCGGLHENGPELYRACPATGVVDDKDEIACVTILARAKAALANRAVSAEKHA